MVGKEQARVPEPDPAGREDDIFCTGDPCLHRFFQVIFPWFDKPGRTEHRDPALNPDPGVEGLLCDTCPERDRERDGGPGKTGIIEGFLHGCKDTGKRGITDRGSTFFVPWRVPDETADPRSRYKGKSRPGQKQHQATNSIPAVTSEG